MRWWRLDLTHAALLCCGGPCRLPACLPPALRAGLTTVFALAGPHGAGKSAAVAAVACELGMRVVEVHPGMERSAAALQRLIGEATQSRCAPHRQVAMPRHATPGGRPTSQATMQPGMRACMPTPVRAWSRFKGPCHAMSCNGEASGQRRPLPGGDGWRMLACSHVHVSLAPHLLTAPCDPLQAYGAAGRAGGSGRPQPGSIQG